MGLPAVSQYLYMQIRMIMTVGLTNYGWTSKAVDLHINDRASQ